MLIQKSGDVSEMTKMMLTVARNFGFESLAELIKNAPGRGQGRGGVLLLMTLYAVSVPEYEVIE